MEYKEIAYGDEQHLDMTEVLDRMYAVEERHLWQHSIMTDYETNGDEYTLLVVSDDLNDGEILYQSNNIENFETYVEDRWGK